MIKRGEVHLVVRGKIDGRVHVMSAALPVVEFQRLVGTLREAALGGHNSIVIDLGAESGKWRVTAEKVPEAPVQ